MIYYYSVIVYGRDPLMDDKISPSSVPRPCYHRIGAIYSRVDENHSKRGIRRGIISHDVVRDYKIYL